MKMEEVKTLIEKLNNKHEENMRNYISGHSSLIQNELASIKSKLDVMNKRLESMESRIKNNENDILEVKKSIEFNETLTNEKINSITSELNRTVEVMKKEEDKIKEHMRILEDRNRRNNLRIDGIKENNQETWEECEEKVLRVLKTKMGIENVMIERAHRMGRRKNETTRTIIFKLLNWKDKELILKNKLKDTGIFINEDYSEATNNIRKELRKEMKKQREAGKYSIIIYDRLFTTDFKHPRN